MLVPEASDLPAQAGLLKLVSLSPRRLQACETCPELQGRLCPYAQRPIDVMAQDAAESCVLDRWFAADQVSRAEGLMRMAAASSPVPREVQPPTPPAAAPVPIVFAHPDHCRHKEKTLNHQGCCSQRTWLCEIRGTVRLDDCRKCGEFERDLPQ